MESHSCFAEYLGKGGRGSATGLSESTCRVSVLGEKRTLMLDFGVFDGSGKAIVTESEVWDHE